MKLTKTQQKTLDKLKGKGKVSAYKLQVSLSTLRGLRAKGLVKMYIGFGATVWPRTAILWEAVNEQ